MGKAKTYIAIDLKSFYASVECVERNLDPLTTNLVVADESRTEKTICLAATPSIKRHGISGRSRLFEVVQKIREANQGRRLFAPGRKLEGESYDSIELEKNPNLAITYITAVPRMALYMKYSARIYGIYLRYVAAEDVHPYSIDEVFIDATPYLKAYRVTARELTLKMVRDVLAETGITATAGIGTNMYLAKVAMDIVAKHMPPDEDGVRIAELDEWSYRKKLWAHTPITDFWRIGRGYAKRLESRGMYTMGDVARESMTVWGEDTLHKMFGVCAELLIDHAWGIEPCSMEAVKKYRPAETSMSSGQVLHCPYSHENARLIVWEMADQLVLDMVAKKLLTNQLVLDVGYDIENLKNGIVAYQGPIHIDHYGRKVPKAAHGTVKLEKHTSSTKLILGEILSLYERITQPELLVRRITITAGRLILEGSPEHLRESNEEINLFEYTEAFAREAAAAQKAGRREKSLQHTMIAIKNRYGKNSIMKAANLKKEARAMERNREIGGHRA